MRSGLLLCGLLVRSRWMHWRHGKSKYGPHPNLELSSTRACVLVVLQLFRFCVLRQIKSLSVKTMAQQTADYQGQVVYGLTMGEPTSRESTKKKCFQPREKSASRN